MAVSPVNIVAAWNLQEFKETGIGERSFDVPMGITSVGRTNASSFCLPAGSISKQHAEIERIGERLYVRDLGSTNGTYINGTRITERVEIRDGDLVQFASIAFRATHFSSLKISESIPHLTITDGLLSWTQALLQFDRLMNEKAVIPHYQKIVRLADREVIAYEVLARSNYKGLEGPAQLFSIAERLEQEETLSELMRTVGVRASQSLGNQKSVYLNTHPKEAVTERFLDSLRTLRMLEPDRHITIEIHEEGVTRVNEMKRLRSVLTDLGMHLAYDDFGVGQARLVELTDVPPDVLKFDMGLIRDIDKALLPRRAMVKALIDVCHSLEIIPLAEGVETEAEHQACLDLGFSHGQGYLYGRPSANDEFIHQQTVGSL